MSSIDVQEALRQEDSDDLSPEYIREERLSLVHYLIHVNTGIRRKSHSFGTVCNGPLINLGTKGLSRKDLEDIFTAAQIMGVMPPFYRRNGSRVIDNVSSYLLDFDINSLYRHRKIRMHRDRIGLLSRVEPNPSFVPSYAPNVARIFSECGDNGLSLLNDYLKRKRALFRIKNPRSLTKRLVWEMGYPLELIEVLASKVKSLSVPYCLG